MAYKYIWGAGINWSAFSIFFDGNCVLGGSLRWGGVSTFRLVFRLLQEGRYGLVGCWLVRTCAKNVESKARRSPTEPQKTSDIRGGVSR